MGFGRSTGGADLRENPDMTTTDDVATWSELEAGAPAIAAAGRSVLARGGEAGALLATIRGDASPRIHPVTVAIVDGGLYVFLLDSAKRRDLAEDGQFALHGHQDPAAPTEFSVRGHARLVPAGTVRDRVAAGWAFEVDDSYWLFELRIGSAILGERAADEWPPRYTRWSATAS